MGWTDGSVKHHPNLSEVIVDPKTVPESRELQWLEKLGISAWPEGYTLLIRITRPGGKIRYDQYIYGHPAGKFRSIREFTPHLDFLANPSEKCHCCLCGRLSQPTTLVPATPIQWISKSTDGDSAAETPPPGNTARKNCSLRDPNRSPRISKANVTHLDKPSDQLTYWRWQDGYRPGEIVWVLFKVIDEKRRSWWPAQVTSRVELPQTENDCARTETLSMDSSNEEVTSQSSNTRSGPPGLSLRTDTVTSEGIKRTAESLTDEDLPFVKRNQNDLTARLWRSSLPLERNGEKEAGRSKGFVQENSPGLPFSSRSSAMKVAGYNNPETFAYYELRMLPLRDRPMPFAELSEAPVDVLVPSSEIKPFLNHIVAPRANDSVKWHKAVIQAIGLSTTCGPLESTIPERKPGLVPNPSQFCRDVEDLKQSSYTKCIDRFRLGTEEIRLNDLVRLPVVEDRRFEFAGLPQIVRDIHKRYLAGRTPPLYMEVLGIEYRGPSPAIFVTGRLYRQILIQDTEGRSRRGNFAVAFDPITDLPDMSANSSHTGFARPLITSVDTAAPDVNVNSDIVPPDSTIKVTMNALELAGRAYPNFMDLKSDRMPVVECTHKLG